MDGAGNYVIGAADPQAGPSPSSSSDIKFLVNFLEVMTQASQDTTVFPATHEATTLFNELTDPTSTLSTYVHRGVDQIMEITDGKPSTSTSNSSNNATPKHIPSRSTSNSHYPNCRYYSSAPVGTRHNASPTKSTSSRKSKETAGERDLRTINGVLSAGAPVKKDGSEKGRERPEGHLPSRLTRKESFTNHISH